MPEQLVLDPASGSRMFYFDKTDPRVMFGDIRTEEHVLSDGRSLSIQPAMEMDFRALPFDDGSYRVVVFDPPHLVRVGDNAWMGKKYGRLNPATWRDDLRAGFSECLRVLVDHGVLIFKWNETQIPVRQILALTPHPPLVGHRSGKTAKTHWVTFLKTPRMSRLGAPMSERVCPERRDGKHRNCIHEAMVGDEFIDHCACGCEPSRTCPNCGDVVPVGWTLDDHFTCNFPEDRDV